MRKLLCYLGFHKWIYNLSETDKAGIVFFSCKVSDSFNAKCKYCGKRKK